MNIYLLIIVLLLGAASFIGVDYFSDDNKAVDTGSEISDSGSSTTNSAVTEPTTSTQVRGLVIDLSNKSLTKAPEYIFKESGTETLNLSNNKLTGALQAEIRFLANLRVFDLSNNDFTGVPAEIGQLKNLEVLNLSGNPITGLPYELANLKKLRSLDLRGTSYSAQDLDVIKKGLPANVVIYLK